MGGGGEVSYGRVRYLPMENATWWGKLQMVGHASKGGERYFRWGDNIW